MLFDSVKYQFRLWQLFRRQDKNTRFYDRRLLEAKARNARQDEYQEIVSERIFEDGQIQSEIDLYTTRYLLRYARRLMIATPGLGEEKYWKESDVWNPRNVLSREGIRFLRSEIRAELKERRESWSHWFALLIGIIGALTGLLAVVLTKNG